MMESSGISRRGESLMRKPSQQSNRIKLRRAYQNNEGPTCMPDKVANQLKRTARAYTTSRTCMMFVSLATLSSCLFYILGTYFKDRSWVTLTETAYGVVFLADYSLTAIASPVPMTYVRSSSGMTDLVSCLPAFGALIPWMTSLGFVRYLRVSKAIRVLRDHSLLKSVFSNDDVTIKATLLIVKVVGVVMMTSAILFGVERGFEDYESEGVFNEPGWQWHDAFYYTVVTLSTVGYGDVLPVSAVSRLLIVLVIIFALTYIPLEVGKLVDAINSRPKFRRGFSRSIVGIQLHVVLAMSSPAEGAGGGTCSEFDSDMLERCVSEFFDDDQRAANVSAWVVIMAPTPPSEEINALCRQPKYHSRVVYFRGSVTNPRDMAAVCAEYADCIFLFPTRVVDGDLRAAEETTHLAAKAVRRYIDRTPTDSGLMEKVKYLSQTGNPRRTVITVDELHSKDQLLGFGIDHVICLGELKMSMLASATLCPAFLPFVANSVRSSPKGASSIKARTRRNRGPSDEGWDWLDDYTIGTNFEVYSIPLDVLSVESKLWGMSFSRAARTMYDESEGKVILLAVAKNCEPPPSSASKLSHHQRLRRSLSVRPGMGQGFIAAAAVAAAEGRGRELSRPRWTKGQQEREYAKVEVFPDEYFRFTIDCHVLVLAETQTFAEDLVFSFQDEAGGGVRGSIIAPTIASPAYFSPSSPTAAVAPMAASIVPPGGGGGGGGGDEGSGVVAASPAKASAAATTTVAAATAAGDAAAASTTTATAVTAATGSPTYPSSFSSSNHPSNAVFASDPGVPGTVVDACLEEFSPALATGESRSSGLEHNSQPLRQQQQQQDKERRNYFSSFEAFSARAIGSFHYSSASAATSTASRPSRSRRSMRMDEESKEELNAPQTETFRNDEVDWTHSLDALKRARAQLDELNLERDSTKNPAEFFDKVAAISGSVSDALRLHSTSLPPGLTGHIVLVGGNSRLHHYIVALRRQQPLKPIVVVMEDEVSFFELRDRLLKFKFLEMSLDISQVYHVFGRTQDRFSLEEANAAEAESVMLMSDDSNDTDVLLGSFELEQVLEDIAPGKPRPKVLIDLAKDDSIYYCSAALGGTDDSNAVTVSSGSSSGRKKVENLLAQGNFRRRDDVRYWPLFAAGGVWTTSIMDAFAVRTYFNAHVLAFFEALLHIDLRHPPASESLSQEDGGGSNSRASADAGAASASAGENFSKSGGSGEIGSGDSASDEGKSIFAHLRVSASFSGQTYGHLTRHLIDHGAMPLGLYRPTGTKGSTLAYTHINPSPDELLRPWPAVARAEKRDLFVVHDGDDDDEAALGGSRGRGRSGGGSGAWGRIHRMNVRAGGVKAGDDVFVLRSRGCRLSGEVSC